MFKYCAFFIGLLIDALKNTLLLKNSGIFFQLHWLMSKDSSMQVAMVARMS